MAMVLCVTDDLLLVARTLLGQERISQYNDANILMHQPSTYAVSSIATIMRGDPIPLKATCFVLCACRD